MEALVILLFIILIVLILSFRSSALQKIQRLEEEIARLRKEMNSGVPAARPIPPPAIVPPETAQPHVFPERRSAAAGQPEPAVAGHAESAVVPRPPSPQPAMSRPGFFERHPDLEKFIGENLISKIGIAILVLAIGFFVKYAIDNDWIGPVGRVGVGLLCGGILIGIAHLLRNSYKGYKAFSSVLVGGGLAIFYFTIALAFHEYNLFGQTTAFIIMLFITAFSVILALLYDRQELAIIALVGGFVAPFLVSQGSGNYKVLFSYLLILNTGLLVMAYNKAWRLLNVLAFGFTVILFASWLLSLPGETATAVYSGGFCFATAFYILFFVINIANNIRENKKFIASDFGILLANTCLYFGGGLYLIAEMRLVRYQGLFSALMAVFNLLTSYFLFRKKAVDSNILYLLIGITLSFVSLTAPIQLHGHYITLFWASESVLLYWLYQRSQIRIIRLASFLIRVAMIVSLVLDWVNVYGQFLYRHGSAGGLPIVFNKGFLTSLYASCCCFALFRLRRETPGAKSVLLTGACLLFISGALEIHHQFVYYYPASDLSILYLLFYTYAYLFLFTFLTGRIQPTNLYPVNAVLLGICIVLCLLFIPLVFDIQRNMLEGGGYGNHFIVHWAADGLIAGILYRLIDWQRRGKLRMDASLFAWVAGAVIVLFFSAELQLLIDSLFYSTENSLSSLQRVYIKTGLPILWGCCSFVFMWLGMHHKFKPLRILSLFLFSLTLLKLFLFDIRNIPVAGKIAAFFCLGILLLVVSFMYQRLKKIIIEDEEKTTI
jgi:uncharacterized membrane protein